MVGYTFYIILYQIKYGDYILDYNGNTYNVFRLFPCSSL